MTQVERLPQAGSCRRPALSPLDSRRNRRAAAQQRTRTARRIFRRVCGCLSVMSFLALLAVAGGMESGTTALLPGAAVMFGCVTLFGMFAKLAGAMY